MAPPENTDVRMEYAVRLTRGPAHTLPVRHTTNLAELVPGTTEVHREPVSDAEDVRVMQGGSLVEGHMKLQAELVPGTAELEVELVPSTIGKRVMNGGDLVPGSTQLHVDLVPGTTHERGDLVPGATQSLAALVPAMTEVHAMDDASDAARTLRAMCQSGVHEEAFYVLDVADVVRKHREWLEKMPRVQPYYAVKCNENLDLIRVLASLGTGFDCASKAEIDQVLGVVGDPGRIIYANPAKSNSHIRHAAALGVDLLTFDNADELRKIKRHHPRAELILRIRCDAIVSLISLGDKFGCDPVEEGPRLLRLARDLDLAVVGVSFHVGSGCGEPPVFRRALAAVRQLFDVGTSMGHCMRLVDLGGGFPGEKGTSIDEFCDVINAALSDLFPPDDVIRVIAEPGRYYVASAFTLATRIHSKRASVSGKHRDVDHIMYYIDDGVYGSFGDVVYYDVFFRPSTLTPLEGKLFPSSVWGPSCDTLDKVNDRLLLPEMQVGDWLVYDNMGAYTLSVAGHFNGFTEPPVHVVPSQDLDDFLKKVN